MIARHTNSKLIRPILLVISVIFGMLMLIKPTFADYDITPVIDDQLGILSESQKQAITDANEQLASKPNKQQIWFISTDMKNDDLNNGDYYMDWDSIKELGFNFANLQQEGVGLHDALVSKYTHTSYSSDDYESVQKNNDATNKVNIIFVDPNYKYSVLPLLSSIGEIADGTLHSFFLTHQFNYTDTSADNVMSSFNHLYHFTNKYVAIKDVEPGLDFSQMTAIVILAIILLGIFLWLRHRHNYHGPKHTSFWDSDGDSSYDNGFIDGWNYGDNDDNDTFKY